MTITAPTPTSRLRPLTALAKAEYLQFRRNRTLMFMGTAFPIGIPLMTYILARRQDASPAEMATLTLEMFAYIGLIFVQYYSVLSLVTTRRGEGVLKRLRTGEAADWQIKTAPAFPGALLIIIGALVMAAIVYGSGAPAPVNVVALLVALLGGVVVFSALALLTAAFTKNAEAAQVTSLPVIALATMGMGTIRSILPDRMAEIVDWTPFAAIGDLVSLGVDGKLAIGSGPVHDFMGTFGEMGQPVVTLVAWTVLALVLTRRSFRWDDRG
ncbi:ABC transporter permease [Aeromicrobium sp. CTD01-1L150]|uniref:ABC transporter permease n=1 Tax=Aeromicrobium sp. CTD01-1L150 TaxID=3341830 RepID=UPI0035C0AF94